MLGKILFVEVNVPYENGKLCIEKAIVFRDEHNLNALNFKNLFAN